jgi:hypothetical protein
MPDTKTALIVLTYNRINFYGLMAEMINNQTIKNFDLYIYNSGPDFKSIESISQKIFTNIDYTLLHTDINEGCWRRHELARDLAKKGYEKILFLDDDIIIPENYVESALKQYEPFSYKSWWAWDLQGGNDYYRDRVQILNTNTPVNYCGTGVSIIDARIFLDPEYFNIPINETKWIDDIWLSFYSKEKMRWKLEYLDIPGTSFSEYAEDVNAMYTNILNKTIINITKKEYIHLLKNKYNWNPIK